MDNAPPLGANPEEAAKWKAADAKRKRLSNPQTVRTVTTQPDGTTTATIHQAGRRDSMWETTIPRPKFSLRDLLRSRKSPEPPPKP